ncbi:glucuronyl hydrolase [Salmonella enterica subsp. enterica]|uniref:glycoside hydrolase family 88 protein n=1 Tax=Salmonella enterica TaxID=28901 RepID=UPI0009B0C8B7|nr:glycoside hydrolase family 88 protein [Salmonella enterica]EBG2394572.1 glucuronyl hydrolase [Salmonella enterica subsp. enterica serovar Everleigh]ECH9427369.1 glucuronyl hydrolase [Salmonella enterica subsp. enterica]EAC1132062.1 glucuronyl hydrolase [Salmonella enterica subsp. enterica serovar Kambole]EBG0729965.1 glucuronyl hydrolase [Salmonella enterica subsp. enterica serovar Kambole]EBS2656208.1 glucuronyl hydrolase [Salmonella enterica subsp. enterica serovar Kambole]
MTVALEMLDSRYLAPQPGLDSRWLREALHEVLAKVDAMLPRFTTTFPAASATDGHYPAVEKVDWTEGFWTGMLWLAWEVTGDDKYRTVSENLLNSFEERLDKQIKVDTHDLGFLYMLSCVNAWKLTGNLRARGLALRAADLLYRRFNATAGVIQAWGDLNDPARQGRMIIDCNLNIPLLFWAADETGNAAWREAATQHLAQAARYLVREDASSFHTFYMDIHSGQPLRGDTHQGFNDSSCWARGQAWGIYGFALGFRHTGDITQPELARKLAHYFLNRLPEDFICYWDLIFTPQDNALRDTSAAAVAACGLTELLTLLPLTDPLRSAYSNAIELIMRNLRERYFAHTQDGLLREGVYNFGRNMGINEPNLWGDYFYFEALVRLSRVWPPYFC